MRSIIFLLLITLINTLTSGNILPPKFIHYTNKEGLSSSYVKGIKQDKYGFIWVATRENITRFESNRFVNFPTYDILNKEIDLEPQSLQCINDSIILVESMQNFFYYFDYDNECFKPYSPLYNNQKQESISGISSDNALYIQNKSIYSLNLHDKSISYSNLFSNKQDRSAHDFLKLSANKNIIVAYTSQHIVLVYNLETKTIHEIKTNRHPDDEINFIKVDNNNNIWLGYYLKGLIKINYPSGKKENFSTNTTKKLPHNMVHCVAIDSRNRAWIGTENGLCIWDEYNDEFKCFKYDRRNPEGLNTNPIYNAMTDREGNIWLGTYFGGINLWSGKPTQFTHWKAGTSDAHLGGKVVSCFLEDSEKNIWIGTEDMGVSKLNPKSGIISKVTESLPEKNLSYENVHDILLIDSHQLWFATYSGGINVLNLKNNDLRCIQVNDEPALGSDFIYALTQKDHIIYIGTDKGISTYNLKTKKFSRLHKDKLTNEVFVSFTWKGNILWLCSNGAIYSYNTIDGQLIRHEKLSKNQPFSQIFCDSKGQIWITTNNSGLLLYNENDQTTSYFNKDNGFPTNRVFSIVEANDQTIWVSTNFGLVNLNPEEKSFIHFDSNAGVPFNQFNYRAGFKDSNGIIYFGGNEGMISINPESIDNTISANIQFTELKLFNQHISPGRKQPISKSITSTSIINLKHNQNVFSINYSSLNYTNKGLVSYAYKLEGFDKNFNYVGNKNSANYTNLDPGKYTFIVKSSIDAWVNESSLKKINIHIKPPFWLTPLAFAAYAMIFLTVVLILNNINTKMQRSKAAIALERQKRLHNEEINNFKLEFFTNISHEIKTPLSLILGPLSSLLEEYKFEANIKDRLNRIYINVSRLNSLLGELLEFRKIDKTSVNFKVNKCTDLLFIKNIEDAFRCIAEHGEINFDARYNKKISEIWLNKAVIEKIIFNLLSNSFKYCNPNDTVELVIDTSETNNYKELVIVIKDNGPGISDNELSKVQTRFYQSSKAKKINNGAGIGLSYVNNLVKMHHGVINIKSKIDVGTTTKIIIPCSIDSYEDVEIYDNLNSNSKLSDNVILDNNIAESFNETDILLDKNSKRASLLIVEDNKELLNFLKETLNNYNITTATNGKKALSLIQDGNNNFDLVVSDIMMPEMDGLEFTRILKSNIETSHIPILLLTAKSGTHNQYEGLKHGADIYLEKPFLPQILKQSIFNIIRTRLVAINKFSENIEIEPAELTTSTKDKEFIEELTNIIEENIDNSSMDVQFLISKLHISRSLLHIKLKGLLNCSTTEYIRIIRLRKAIEFITNENCSFSEAAYKTGFTSLTYFSRTFKNQYGKSPRDYFNRT